MHKYLIKEVEYIMTFKMAKEKKASADGTENMK